MKRSAKTLQYAAHHEAGHAVAAVLLCHEFDYVTIVPDDDSGGHISHTRRADIVDAWNEGNRNSADVAQYMEHELIVTLAGSASQRLFFPRSRWRYGFGEGTSPGGFIPAGTRITLKDSDLQTVTDILHGLHGYDEAVFFAYHAFVQARASYLVRTHRAEIERVAAALLDRKTLLANEVRAAMGPEYVAPGGPKP
jgi:ATP-dependent Zn protease